MVDSFLVSRAPCCWFCLAIFEPCFFLVLLWTFAFLMGRGVSQFGSGDGRKYSPEIENSEQGNSNGKQQTANNNNYPEKDSSSWEGQKRRKKSDEEETASFKNKVIEVLERNNRILYAQLEAHNLNCQLDREQMKDQADGIVNVMTKRSNILERIADKLENSKEISILK